MNIKKFYLLLIIAFTFWAQNAWGQTYKRINSTSDLVAGDKYIITSAYDDGSTYILGYQKTNNRDGAPTATISSGIISSLTIAIANTNTANAYEITLGGSTGAWTLNDTYNGYLYAASSSNNYLKTQATNNANGQWAISFSSNVASIVAQGTNTRKVMQYNYNLGSPLFTCYSSASQAAVYLFRRAYTVTYVGNGNDGGSVPTDASSPYFSGATVTVKANTGSLTKTGYTFAGWDSNNDGTADFTGTGSETFIMSSSNVTLKAVWSSSGSTPPTLTAAGSPTVDAAFDVTFTDDATWRAAITGITIGGTPLTAGWSASSGTITFTPSSSTPAGLLQTAGSKSIVVTATGYSNATVSQDIGFGAAAKLGITQQPTAPASNGAVLAQQPVVVIQDQYGNTVTSSSASVNAAVGSGTWTIGGTSSISASSGVASFTNLTATSAAAVTGATINFSSTGLTGITSGAFNIPAPPPANDSCGGVVALTIDAVATSGTLTAATYTAFTNASNKNDVWYKFTPACSGNNTITVTFSSGPDIDFEVFSNSNVCPTNNNQRVVNANSSNATSETNNSYTFLKGVTYYIRVLEYSGTASNFDIRVTSPTSATQAVTTNAASSITASGATLNGQISTLGVCPTSNGKGFVYAETSVNSNPLKGGTGVTTVAVSSDTIPQTLTAFTNTPSLTAATGYSYKAYVIDEDGNYTYGAVQTFTTLATEPANNPTTSAVRNSSNPTSAIDVSWTSVTADGYIVIRRIAAQPEAPTDGTAYSVNDNIGTSSQVAYIGTETNFTDGSLTPGTEYRYRVYAFNGTGAATNYKTSPAPDAATVYTLATEPSDYQTLSFTAVATSTSVTLGYPAANTISPNAGNGYIILYKEGSGQTLAAGDLPTDGQSYTSGNSIGAAIVGAMPNSGQTSSNITGLTATKHYTFFLLPFAGSGSTTTYNYKTDGTPSSLYVPSFASSITTGNGEAATISSITNGAISTVADGTQVWSFNVVDGTDDDALGTTLDALNFTQGIGNTVSNWSNAIEDAAIFDGSTLVAHATVTANQLQFTGLGVSVTDNGSVALSLRITVKANYGGANGDNQIFRFQISNGNVAAASIASSSQFTFNAINTDNTKNKYSVTATKLAFVQQPTDGTAFNNIAPAVTVKATDANGNVDKDFTAAVAITATGSVLKNSPVSQSSVSGLATFSNLQFAKAGTGVTLTATSGSLTNAVSNGFTITLGSPIVALAQWTFEGITLDSTAAATASAKLIVGSTTADAGEKAASSDFEGVHSNSSTIWYASVGNGSPKALRADKWASGDYYQFKTSSSGYQNITLSFDQTGSNTGPRDFKIQYSTDGSTFTDLSGGSYQLTNDSWSSSGDPKSASSRSFDLSSVTALNNQANIYIRFTVNSSTAINGSSIGSGGAGRVDNVTIKGAAITFTWNGAGDGINWNDAANWDCNCGISPTINNPVVIPNGSNVVLNTDYTARNLQLQATSSLKIAPNKTLMVEGYADFNGQHVTVQSDATGTGMIGQVTGLIDNATNVTVERYISASSNRAYRMLTPSVTTTNYIRDNWQEGTNNPDKVTNNNPNAGYGTHITGTGGSSNGFDVTQTNQSSLFKLVSGAWVAVGNTNATKLYADQAYLLFVRGSRDNINTINTASGSSNTTLRATGTLKQGAQAFASLPASDFSLVSNPFAAPINWANVYSNNSSNFENYITIWDPNVGTRGGYVTVNNSGTNNIGGSHLNAHIQTGQAFFVTTKSGGTKTLNIAEADKSTTNNLDVYRENNTSEERLNILLRFKESATNKDILADGVLARFDASYSNEVISAEDAEQIINWDEDIALQRGGKKLSIESRKPITTKDTLFLQIANLKAAQSNYRWVMAPQNFATDGSLVAFLEDAYTGSRKAVSLTDSTTINFTVNNNAGSTAANRFRIVFTERTLYYSKATNIEASDVNSWSSTPDGTGNSPANFDEVANFIVQQNHKLQATNNIHLTQGSLTLQPYAGINHTATISLTGNIENNGSLTGTGVVILNASIPQYISGTGSISNLKLDNTTGAVIKEESKLYISSSYTPTAGILTTHNNLVLQSTETQTASINKGNAAGNYLKGAVRIERYIPAKASRKWSFITSPITQSIATGWQQQIHITGAGTGGSNCPSLQAHSNGYDATPTNAASIFTYDASKLSGQRWQAPASTLSDYTTAGKAFRVNIRGDRNLGCSLLDGTNNIPSAVTLYTIGNINIENNNAGNFSISYPNVGADNYVFIGNPYPSGISFSALQTANSSNIHNNYAVYIPSNAAGVYTYWDVLSNSFTGGAGYDNATGDKIVSGQALFVQSKTAGNVNLSFTEDMKVEVNSMGYFRNNNNISEKIKISYLQSNDNKIDETVIRYLQDEKISNTQKGMYDIPSMNSGTYISSLKGTTFTAVQSRSLQSLSHDEVWLNIGASQSGSYQLSFSDYEDFTAANIYLIDHLTNTTQNIKENATYMFSVDANNAASKGSTRFSIVFNRTASNEVVYNQIKMYPNPADKQVSLLLPQGIDNGVNYQIKLTDITGKIVMQRQATGGKEVIDIAALTAGIYIVEITDSKGKRVTEKLVKY